MIRQELQGLANDGCSCDYDEVNVEVLDVLIKTIQIRVIKDGKIGDALQVGPDKVYNLLDLTAGVNVLLADNLVPSGKLGQIRLLLGDKNVVVGDKTYDLKTPSPTTTKIEN
jgi:hypothetical protein